MCNNNVGNVSLREKIFGKKLFLQAAKNAGQASYLIRHCYPLKSLKSLSLRRTVQKLTNFNDAPFKYNRPFTLHRFPGVDLAHTGVFILPVASCAGAAGMHQFKPAGAGIETKAHCTAVPLCEVPA
jgi:hypothetical protein